MPIVIPKESGDDTEVLYGPTRYRGSITKGVIIGTVAIGVFVGVAVGVERYFFYKSKTEPESEVHPDVPIYHKSQTSPTTSSPVHVGKYEPEVYVGKYGPVAREINEMMSHQTKPCDDFYKYACGGWMALHPAEGYKSHSVFENTRDSVQRTLFHELRRTDNVNESPRAVKTAKRLYQSCADTVRINALKGRPLQSFLPLLGASGYNGLTHTLVNMGLYRQFPLALLEVVTDPKDSSKHILLLDQPDLPFRMLHYTAREALEDYIREVRRLLTRDLNLDYSFFGNLDELLTTHASIADITTDKDDRPDVSVRYHKYTLGRLKLLYPGFHWKEYVQQMLARPEVNITVDDSEPILVYAPDYFRKVSRYLQSANQTQVLLFMRWNFIHGVLGHLSYEYRHAVNKLYKEPPRWKTCTDFVDQTMGNVTGRLLVQADFDKDAVETTTEMVANIRKVFAERMAKDNWMDSATTAKALEKLNAMGELIGYPPEIMDDQQLNNQYHDVQIKDGEYFKNVMFFLKRVQVQNLQKLRQPTNRHRWVESPTTVNALYQVEKNIIVVPAGILRKPFYSSSYPKSVIYARLGMVVAHEMTHGFDSTGSKFDKDGSLKNWWSSESAAQYRQKETCYKLQYSLYMMPKSLTLINGTKMLAENIADNGGVADAFQAYTEWLGQNVTKEATLPALGLNHAQVFYVAFAQRWCETRGENAERQYVQSAVHGPGAFRVKGTLQNSDHFAQTFSCPEISNMNSHHRCTMW